MPSKVKFPKSVKTKWLKALWSGEYKQGKHCLYDVDEGTYCCLGVLCKVVGKDPRRVTRIKYMVTNRATPSIWDTSKRMKMNPLRAN